MSLSLRTLAVLTALVFFAGCDSSDPIAPDDDPIVPPEALPTLAIEDVRYVNKQVHNSHLYTLPTTGFSRTVDLTIDFADEVRMDQIGRILIYGTTPAANLGWEVGRAELAALTMEAGSVLRLPDLVYLTEYYPTASDVFFEIVVEGIGAQGTEYDFIHKNRFPVGFNTVPAWFDREQLSVSFDYDCCNPASVPDGAQAIWLDDDVQLGTSEALSGGAVPPNVRLFDDVPSTASAYYTVIEGALEGIETEILTAITDLPTRIPPNTAFVEGIETGSFDVVYSNADVFALRDYQNGRLHVIRPDATVAGSFELGSNPTAFYVDATAAYVGYNSGRLDMWDLTTGTQRRIGTYDLEISSLGYVEGYLLVGGRTNSSDRKLYVVDLATGTVTNTDDYYPYYDFPLGLVYNERHDRIYGSFGSQILSASFNASTGSLDDFRTGGYNSNAYPEPPLHLFPDEQSVLTGRGGIYRTSSNPEVDMDYLGKFEFYTYDVAFLTESDRMLAIRGNYEETLDLYALSTREHLRDLTVPGRPSQIVRDGARVYVLSTSNSYNLPRLMVTALDEGDLTVARRQKMPYVVARPVAR